MEMTNHPTKQVTFPGFVDLQVNGFAGVDFNNPKISVEDIHRAIGAIRSTGVTRFLPTLITSSLEKFKQCATNLNRVRDKSLAGIHMEGPYISAEDGPRGAHPVKHVQGASVEDFCRRQEAAEGRIKLLTLAPEVPGAMELIEYLVEHGIVVAVGHSAATGNVIADAIKAGAKLSTHLGNGCANPLPRHPNLIWEQLAADELMASLIVDGHHLPSATVKAMIRAKQTSRVILVTDAISAAGCPPGEYELNGERVILNAEGRVSPPGKPWLAGSSLTMDKAIGNTVRFTRLSLEEIIPMATSRPAELLGIKTSGTVNAEWDEVGCRLINLKISDS